MYTYYIAGFPIADELYHHGIKGQKWGIRRFQNEDRSLTPAGKERYGRGTTSSDSNENSNKGDTLRKAAKYAAIGVGTAAAAYGAYKLGTSDMAKEFLASQKIKAAMAKDASLLSMRKMESKDLDELLGRLRVEDEIRRKTYDALTSSADPKTNAIMNAGKKVIEAGLTGVASYAGYAILSKAFDRRQAANYIFPNPNKKGK